ncbi:HAD family hydrolase [Candidatus Poribacteria bacterium]|nr:HAD family hydrolase [Candidatus Poribacteria bacterium]
MERGRIRSALFDFDGTVSLIRTGWQDIMVPMMVEFLRECGTDESDEDLRGVVVEYVDKLTGKETLYQMMQLADEVRTRGGSPLEPLEYKRIYNDRLMERIASRRDGLRSGSLRPDDLMMPRTVALLDALRERGVALYLASGTDIGYVLEEADLLGVTQYFDGGVYAALDRVEDFSKAMVIQQILREHKLSGPELLAFGDGYVEILNTVEVGGIAVGVASDEVAREGVNEWKRNRLIQAGAAVVVPGYEHLERLLAYLFDEEGL